MSRNKNKPIRNPDFYLHKAEDLAKIGFYELNLDSNTVQVISNGIYKILESNINLTSLNNITDLMRQSDAKLLLEVISSLKNTKQEFRKLEHILHIENDKMKFVAHSLFKLPNENIILGMLQNVSSKYHNEREILKNAYYDPLTKLLNRSGFERHLNLSIKLAENVHGLAVVFIDLDDFKKINDTMGHDAGDEVLLTTTNKISEFCNNFKFCYSDTDIILSEIIPCRFGGDEFIICLPFFDDISIVKKFGQELVDYIKTPTYIKGREIRITTSVGISCYPDNGRNFLDLLKKADTAMYQAKQNHKNGYCLYNEKMGMMIKHKLKLESKLIDAIKNHRIKVFYQPKVCLDTAKITSFEVLMRWDDHEQGLIYPSEFMSIAEETDLILELTDYIIDKCYHDYLNYFKQYHVYLSINLSARQFSSNLFSSTLFNDPDLNTGDFEFEITENVLIDDFDKTREIIEIIRNKGFKCCIDDFGSGYSSFNYIKNLPINTIKMDKTFIDNINRPKDLAIVKAIIYLCKELKLNVVAEGVENLEQLDHLLAFGCNEIQGFVFSQAICLEDIINNKYTSNVSEIVSHIQNYHKLRSLK